MMREREACRWVAVGIWLFLAWLLTGSWLYAGWPNSPFDFFCMITTHFVALVGVLAGVVVWRWGNRQ